MFLFKAIGLFDPLLCSIIIWNIVRMVRIKGRR